MGLSVLEHALCVAKFHKNRFRDVKKSVSRKK